MKASISYVNKLNVNRWMRGSKSTRYAIPRTVWLTRRSLGSMLRAYRMVYVKPKGGEKGKGVMRARKLRGHGRYELRYNRLTRKASSVPMLHKLIWRYKKRGAYIVQQGIRMMKYKGRSFDIRVMTQRKGTKSRWVMTGKCARVAASGLIVTNTSQGGDVLPVWTVLRANMSRARVRSLTHRIDMLSLRIARRYAKKRPRSVVFGVDIAVDRKRRVWMLEINTKPGDVPFRHLKDKSMYRRIKEYRRQGRRRNRKRK